ncbi:hypothetical protein BaRGS_00036727 [Batillaria attramentaria]|uniref:Uncharacterized protein n=1 Tax=Batillaria attramentaria TaxID=370345 RepID=A0ABD0JAL1_9CAEN
MPDHRCAVPELPNDTYIEQGEGTHSYLLNLSIPWATDDDGLPLRSQCFLYRNRNKTESAGQQVLANRSTVSCDDWVFDHSTFTSTFTEEVPDVNTLGLRGHRNELTVFGLRWAWF